MSLSLWISTHVYRQARTVVQLKNMQTPGEINWFAQHHYHSHAENSLSRMYTCTGIHMCVYVHACTGSCTRGCVRLGWWWATCKIRESLAGLPCRHSASCLYKTTHEGRSGSNNSRPKSVLHRLENIRKVRQCDKKQNLDVAIFASCPLGGPLVCGVCAAVKFAVWRGTVAPVSWEGGSFTSARTHLSLSCTINHISHLLPTAFLPVYQLYFLPLVNCISFSWSLKGQLHYHQNFATMHDTAINSSFTHLVSDWLS